VSRIINLAPNNLIGNAIKALLSTGMRTQELLALTVADVEPDGSLVDINKAVVMVKGKAIIEDDHTKTLAGKRSVIVAEFGREALVWLRKNAKSKYLFAGRGVPVMGPSAFREKYEDTIAEIKGIRRLTPHCCRHTYVTLMQGSGVELEALQSLVGHEDDAATAIYTHELQEHRTAAVDAYNKVIDGILKLT
jgi:integrase